MHKLQKKQDGVTQAITMNGIHQMQWNMEPSVTIADATKIGTQMIVTATQMETTPHIVATVGKKMVDIGVQDANKITGIAITLKQE